MTIVIVRTIKGNPYAERIRRFVESQGIQCLITPAAELIETVEKNNLSPTDTLIHARTAGPVVNEIYASLERRGFRVINSSLALTRTNNKYLSQEHAVASGIPVAETLKTAKSDFAGIKSMVQKHQTVVAKPIYSQGQGIFCSRLDASMSDDEFKKILETVPGNDIQIQQYIKPKRLIRVIVIDYKALKEATCYDVPPEGEWKCSVCLNPRIKHFTDDAPQLFELAERTARAFEARVNFIDFFETESGEFILNEINTACSLRLHEECTGVKIHEHIGAFLVKAAEEKTV